MQTQTEIVKISTKEAAVAKFDSRGRIYRTCREFFWSHHCGSSEICCKRHRFMCVGYEFDYVCLYSSYSQLTDGPRCERSSSVWVSPRMNSLITSRPSSRLIRKYVHQIVCTPQIFWLPQQSSHSLSSFTAVCNCLLFDQFYYDFQLIRSFNHPCWWYYVLNI